MFLINKYVLTGIVVLMMSFVFIQFSILNDMDYDHSGIVHDVNKSSNGYTFYIETIEGDIHCYNSEEPFELGHYEINGHYSEDGSMFFIESMRLLDNSSNDVK